MDAGRNALSFFMLLVVSLGLSVVRESIGTKMFKCQALTGAHFVFGGNPSFAPAVISGLIVENCQFCTLLESLSSNSSRLRP